MPDIDPATVPPISTNPDAVAALKKIGWTNLIAWLSGGALLISQALPDVINSSVPLIPANYAWIIPVLVIAGNAAQVLLGKLAKQDHVAAVDTALYTKPPGLSAKDAYK